MNGVGERRTTMRDTGRSHVRASALCIAPGLLLVCAGCIAHGDFIYLCQFYGQLVNSASDSPLAHASVFLTTNEAGVWDRAKMRETTTDERGRFDIEATIGGGSVTWIIFIPIVQGDRSPPIVETVYVEIERDDQVGRLRIPVLPGMQERLDTGRSVIDLGTLTVQLKDTEKPSDPAGSSASRS